jgi:hypothetical protein
VNYILPAPAAAAILRGADSTSGRVLPISSVLFSILIKPLKLRSVFDKNLPSCQIPDDRTFAADFNSACAHVSHDVASYQHLLCGDVCLGIIQNREFLTIPHRDIPVDTRPQMRNEEIQARPPATEPMFVLNISSPVLHHSRSSSSSSLSKLTDITAVFAGQGGNLGSLTGLVLALGQLQLVTPSEQLGALHKWPRTNLDPLLC